MKLKQIRNKHPFFDTVQTGYVPDIYPLDIVRINERSTEITPYIDKFIMFARVIQVYPQERSVLVADRDLEEVERYNQKFNPNHYFFRIRFQKLGNNPIKEIKENPKWS
jgi:hypothetical protein